MKMLQSFSSYRSSLDHPDSMCCIYPMRMLISVMNQDLKLIVPNLCVAEKENPVSHFLENLPLSIENLVVPGHAGAGFWYANRHTSD